MAPREEATGILPCPPTCGSTHRSCGSSQEEGECWPTQGCSPWGSIPGSSTRTAPKPQHGSSICHKPAAAMPGTRWLSQALKEGPSPAALCPNPPPRTTTCLGPSSAGEAGQDWKRGREEKDPRGHQGQARAISRPVESLSSPHSPALQESQSLAAPTNTHTDQHLLPQTLVKPQAAAFLETSCLLLGQKHS